MPDDKKKHSKSKTVDVDWPDQSTSHDLMRYALDHYVKHRRAVLKKLKHAHSATLKSMDEINELCERFDIEDTAKEYEKIKKYDGMWEKIIILFRDAAITQEELDRIETVLITIPKAIKQYYDVLVEQDVALQQLLEELQSEDYERAIQTIKQIQNRPNLMSGLGPEEYDLADVKEAYLFSGLPIREIMH